MSRKYLLLVLLMALPMVAWGDEAEDLRAGHREAARRFFDSFSQGLKLSGSVTQNESVGSFEAFFYGDAWLVRERFGDLVTTSYNGEEGSWTGSNYSLPYELTPEDNPASVVMTMLANGAYLSDPLWESFEYVGEEAGGYNFRFTPPDLPAVDVVLYSDPEVPNYLQLLSAEVPLCADDPASLRHRSFYYYTIGDEGRIYTQRETGREVDQDGSTVNFTDFNVEQVEPLDQSPPELTFEFDREPVGDASTSLSTELEIPVDVTMGYFLIPLSFEGDTETYYFLLDTGASASLLTPQAADAAGLGSSLALSVHGHGSRADFELGMCTTASVGEADAEQRAPLAGFIATRIPESNIEILEALKFYNAAGIVGVSLLHQYVATFDYPGKKLVLWPPHTFDPDEDVPRPNIEIWLDVEDLIYCKGRINDSFEGEVIIDTGLQQDLSILSETMDRAGLSFEKIGERSNTVVGGVKSFDYVVVPSFELGPLRLEQKVASVTEDDRGSLTARGLLGFVGLPLFLDGRITLDLFRERMYIEPPTELGYFPGLGPPPESTAEEGADDISGEKPADEAEPQDEDDTELPVPIGSASQRFAG